MSDDMPDDAPADERAMLAPPSDPEPGTIGWLLRWNYGLRFNCRHCERWVDLDLAAMPATMIYVGRRARCVQCNRPGSLQIHYKSRPH